MTTRLMHWLLDHVRKQALRDQDDAISDGDLLRRFFETHDEEAFEALVWRHGAMVLGVCRRVLGNGPDAEDAFQATFLVLVRRAAALTNSRPLGPWLYGVALRTARTLRTRQQRRREEPLAAEPFAPTETVLAFDLREQLD